MLIHQTNYIENILERSNIKDCQPQSTPMVTRQVNNRSKKKKIEDREIKSDLQVEEIKRVPYREAIESLMYLSHATGSDITFTVNYLARKQLESTEEDCMDVKRVFRYLRGTSNRGLKYRAGTEELEVLTDASFRDCQDSTSTGGYAVKLFGDAIARRSHNQSYVTLSSCQAEYLAMTDACQELISLDNSIKYIIGRTLLLVTIWCHNESAGGCAKKDGSYELKMSEHELEEINKSLLEREREID